MWIQRPGNPCGCVLSVGSTTSTRDSIVTGAMRRNRDLHPGIRDFCPRRGSQPTGFVQVVMDSILVSEWTASGVTKRNQTVKIRSLWQGDDSISLL